MYFKPYEELDFTSDFIFSRLLYENTDLCKELLELILDKPIAKIVPVQPQRSLDLRIDTKGVRFDVYTEEPNAAIYDIEMQVESLPCLPKRSRYYHGLIELDQLTPGSDYSALRPTYVIFICKNGLGKEFPLPFYHFEMMATKPEEVMLKEMESLFPIGDRQNDENMVNKKKEFLRQLIMRCITKQSEGTHTLFLNAAADLSLAHPKLRAFLEFVRNNTPEPGPDSFTSRLSDKVERLRFSKNLRSEYMTLEMKMQEMYREGRSEGRVEGRVEGRSEGASHAWDQAQKLLIALQADNRSDEFAEAIQNEEKKAALLKEFGLED